MRSVVFAVPGRLDTPTGGSVYDRLMSEHLRQQGWSVEVRELDDSFPFPTTVALEHAACVLADLQDGTHLVVDGLALGAMPDIIEHEVARLRIAALVHLPLSADVTRDPLTAAGFEAGERRALDAVALIIVTGTATLSLLDKYGIARHRIEVVEPGTMRAPLARGAGGTPLQLLSVATLNPGKGHEILLEALATVPHRAWHLTCAGSLTRDPATVDRVRAAIQRLGLEERVTLAGELNATRLGACYDRADIFVLATLQETYGMAVAEALAHGIPVVSTTTGAIPDLVGADAGLLAPPGDIDALATILTRVMGDARLRARFTEGARHVRDRLPDWERAAGTMAAALERLDANG